MKHRTIPKRLRQTVYAKYNGHCAYCGCEIEYKDMQIDHINSVFLKSFDSGTDNPNNNQDDGIDNLMPSCRQCNFYKAETDIEGFRAKIHNWLERTCRDSFQVQLAIKHGILTYKPWDGKFYFESHETFDIT